MKILSKDFRNDRRMPSKFTADGINISPQLEWSNAPPETKSFALICVDPDAPSGSFMHWIVYDIPQSVSEIKQGEKAGKELPNSFGKPGYKGPSPPSGVHRYIFNLYALNTEHLTVTRENFLKEFEKHKLDSAQIVGLYEHTTIK